MAKNSTIASVLAFEKKLVPSDGFMYGTTWQERNQPEATQPLKLREKSVRGTVSHRLKNTTDKDLMKLNMDIADPNPQTVDNCALSNEQDTLKLSFTLKILSGVEKPSACNSSEFNLSYAQAANAYIKDDGFKELAKRYAINIANGRFFWRNRVGAEHIEVQVSKLNQNSKKTWVFDAAKLGLRDFEITSADIEELAAEIANALSGEEEFLLLEINAFAQVGKAQDVYPSEEMVLDKSNSKSKKSKILYHINGIAGMHSQKIGNALRTIDTWYPLPENEMLERKFPIAIEVYGAVTNLGRAYRTPKKADFYTLFDKFVSDNGSDKKEDAHYVMAVLVRGGVFGQKSE